MTTQTLHIQLLGTFEVRYGETLLAEAYPARLQSLLAYLVLHRDVPQPRQHLAFLFWPDSTEGQARTNLRNLLHRLRETLPDGDRFLHVEGQVVQWRPDAPFTLDVADWDLALAQAEESAGVGDQSAARDALERAAALYRGALLPACYDDWILPQRERLHQAFLEALRRLISLLETEHDYDAAIDCAQRLLRTDPLHEPGYRALMRLHALAGNRAGAVQVYDACAAALERELGVDPEPETTTLYERIRAGEDLKAGSALAPHNLPAELTPFVGRKALLSEIVAHLRDPDCRLLTLVGPGGSGKTRLARQAARAFLSEGASTTFKDGVFFVSLAPLRSSEGVVPTIASAIGFSFYEGGMPKQQLLDYLRQKQMLVILDNFEHLLAPPHPLLRQAQDGLRRRTDVRAQDGLLQGGRRDHASAPEGKSAPPPSTAEAASLVLELLRAASGVKILVTSRTRLNVRGEHLLPIEGMHYPETLPETAAELEPFSAVQLFLASAREVRPGFQPTTDEMEQVIRICQLVEGMPLALLLAAAWMEMLTPAEIAGDLSDERSLDFLAADWRDVPERQRSMRAVFDHSWDLLGEREQQVLQGLSVFRGGFAHQAAKQVADASLRDLMTLINRSLLHRAHTGRYEIHELLRQYAAEKLEQSPGATQAVRDRHSVYYAVALQQWGKDLKGPRQQAALAEMDVEIENARAAWDWAAERGQVERLDQGMEGLCRFYRQRLRREEGETAYRLAADRLALATSGDELRVLAKVLAWQGSFNLLHSVGHLELAGQLLRQSLDLLGDPALARRDTRAEKALVLWRMGRRWDLANDFAEARRLYEQSLRLYRALGDRWEMATVLRRLGWIAWDGGDTDGGRQAFEESLALRRALGDQGGIAESLYSLGTIAAMQGRFEEAERLVREAFAICQQEGDRRGVARGLGWSGYIRLMRGEFAEGQSLLEESVAICDDQGDRYYLGLWNGGLGETKVHLGRYEEARTLGKMCLSLARDIGVQEQIALFLWVLGQVALAEEAYAQAHSLLEESLATFQEVQRLYGCGTALATLTYAARGLGQRAQAWTHLCQALRIGQAGYVELLAIALPAIALLLADQGEAQRAVELYALASRDPYVARSRWFEDVAGKQIAAVAGTLPPDAVAAAQERGRSRDLEATVKELLAELGE